jgi:hypothetical protein
MKINLFMLQIILAASAIAADTNNYTIDYDGPLHLRDQPPTLSLPTGVSIFISEPKVDTDKTYAETLLKSGTPVYSTTNESEIASLVFALQQEDDQERITNVTRHVGLTYHVLFFQNKNKTMMQYRIFEPADIKTIWCDVYPRTLTGFGYFDRDVGSWLHSRLTNSVAAVNGK